MCSFVLQETAQYDLNHGSDVFVLDASKAFDRVGYVKLFRSLVSKGICPVICLFLIKLYTNQNVRLKWGQMLSHSSSISNGEKQGGVLSPLMFSVYINNLLTFLSKTRVGCYIGGVFCGAFGYADDVVLLAPTLSALHVLLRECEVFAHGLTQSYSLNLPYSCHSRLLHVICEDAPIDVQLYRRFLNFFLSLSHSRNSLVKAGFRLVLEGSGTATSETLTVVAAHLRTRRHELHTCSVSLYEPVADDEEVTIAVAVRDILDARRARLFGEGLFSVEECNFALNYLCTNSD